MGYWRVGQIAGASGLIDAADRELGVAIVDELEGKDALFGLVLVHQGLEDRLRSRPKFGQSTERHAHEAVGVEVPGREAVRVCLGRTDGASVGLQIGLCSVNTIAMARQTEQGLTVRPATRIVSW